MGDIYSNSCYTEFMQTDSLFTKIIKGEIPCHKIYEDDKVLAFLDINPFNPGHVLLVPKKQIDHIWDIDDELYQYMWQIAKKIANRTREVLNPPRVGMSVEGFAVRHAHIHIFPLYEGFEHTISKHLAKGQTEPNHVALEQMAKKLAF